MLKFNLPLVSIVTPVYNGAQYIQACIESILAQDYPNIEHIVQDGASTDGTLEILQCYSNRVDWISEPDSGQTDGLNRALQRVKGDIILVLNADDELLPHACSWGVAQLAKYPGVAVVYGDEYIIDSLGSVIQEVRGPQPYSFEKVLCVEHVLPAQAAFIRRSSLEAVGLYADVTLKTCPDYEMWIRLGLKFPMKYVPGFVARYRWHSESEGRQLSIIPKTVKAKRQVMSRVFKDPTTPVSLHRLQQRAHSGAVWWGACMFLWNNQTGRGLLELVHSLYLYPSIEQMPRLKYFSNQMFGFAKPPVIWHRLAWLFSKGIVVIEKGLALIRIKRKGNFAP